MYREPAPPLLDDVVEALDARGFVRASALTSAWDALGITPGDVFARRAARGAIAELVVLAPSADAARSLPEVHALVAAATSLALGTSRMSPIVRVTWIEIASSLSKERRSALAAMRSPGEGPVLVHALHLDTTSHKLWSNEGSTAHRLARCDVDDPVAWLDGIAVDVRRSKKVDPPAAAFTANTVALVSALFTPAAGAVLLAWNLAKTRQRALGIAVVVGTVLLLVVVASVPMSTSVGRAVGIGVGVAVANALRMVTNTWFAPPTRRPSFVLGAALVATGLVLGGAAVAGPVLASAPTIMTLPKGGRLLLGDGADRETARRVGDYLEGAGLLRQGQELLYRVNDGVHELRFVPAPGAEKDRAIVRATQAIVSRLSATVLDGQRARIVFVTPEDREIEHYDGDGR